MGLRIILGQTVYIERRMNNGVNVKGISSIVGAKMPRFLFFDPPSENQRTMIIPPGETCIVRFLQEGTMIGFRARVIRNLTEPMPMMVVDYPKEVEEIGVRQQERISCNIPAVAFFQGTAVTDTPAGKKPGKRAATDADKSLAENFAVMKTVITDLSLGGCMLAVPLRSWEMSVAKILGMERSGALLPVATEIQDRQMHGTTASLDFELPLPAKKGVRKVASAVRWTKRCNGNVFVGIQFMSPEEKLKQDIEVTVRQQREFFTRRIDYFW